MKIYVACGLTHVPREQFAKYTSYIHSLAGALEAEGNKVWYALRDSDPQLADYPRHERARLCYEWDRKMVENADLVIAEATYASVGLGIELQLAQNCNTNVLICFNRRLSKVAPAEYEGVDHVVHCLQIGEGHVSLMALGLPTVKAVVGYDDPVSAIPSVVAAVHSLNG